MQKTPGAISQQDVNLKREALNVTEAQLKQSLEQVYQIRVSLGLPAQPEKGDDLTEVPPDLDQNFSSVREALGELMQYAAPLGIVSSSYNMKPKEVIAEFYKRDPQGNLDRIYAKIIKNAPAIKLAQSKVMEAQSDLDQAEFEPQLLRRVGRDRRPRHSAQGESRQQPRRRAKRDGVASDHGARYLGRR